MARRYREDPDFRAKHLSRTKKNDERYKAEVRKLIEVFRSGGCSLCQEKEPCCLSAHHEDDHDKEFSIGDATRKGFSPARVIKELAKCSCLCENCHRKVHAGVIRRG
jgi:hypothetical protein